LVKHNDKRIRCLNKAHA